jgi:hypothetical protein
MRGLVEKMLVHQAVGLVNTPRFKASFTFRTHFVASLLTTIHRFQDNLIRHH